MVLNGALALSPGVDSVSVREGAADAGNEPCAPLRIVSQIFQHQIQPVLIRILMVAGIPGAVNAGRAAQCVHFQTGIVRHRGQSRLFRYRNGFQVCVFFKSGAGFVHFKVAAGLGLGNDFNSQGRENLFELPQLMCIV